VLEAGVLFGVAAQGPTGVEVEADSAALVRIVANQGNVPQVGGVGVGANGGDRI